MQMVLIILLILLGVLLIYGAKNGKLASAAAKFR